MSVVKLLSRIVAPSEIDMQDSADAVTMHDHTYGITSDPLTQFSCLFSAIIHDLDHPGVPNTTLVNEETEIASKYKGKSIAEQNSVDIAWSMLMSDDFADFRAAIYASDEEKVRFRQLIVNSVMATDIVDKELKALRNARWERAFSGQESSSKKEAVDRKATIVIEHLIQVRFRYIRIAWTTWVVRYTLHGVSQSALVLFFYCCRQVILPIPCSIGTSIDHGTNVFSWKCTGRSSKAARILILQNFGTRVKLDFLTSTSFH